MLFKRAVDLRGQSHDSKLPCSHSVYGHRLTVYSISASFHDKKLQGVFFATRLTPGNQCHVAELVTCGIGFHHAGISFDDRRAVEDLFLRKVIKVIVATSVSIFSVSSIASPNRKPIDFGCRSELA